MELWRTEINIMHHSHKLIKNSVEKIESQGRTGHHKLNSFQEDVYYTMLEQNLTWATCLRQFPLMFVLYWQ